MSDRVWLASYPSSGNTWLRMLIGALTLRPGAALDINHVPGDGGIASARPPFDEATMIDSGLLTHDEIDRLRPRVYEDLAKSRPPGRDGAGTKLPVTFTKVHDAYTATSSGEALLGGGRGASAAILIVRDPRDVASALANHNHSSVDAAIDYMSDAGTELCGRNDRRYHQLRQKLTSWHGHTASWLDQRDIPVHVLRYEDMKRDTVKAVSAALAFAGLTLTPAQVARAAVLSSFENLRAQEDAAGFAEWQDRSDRKFFRRGEAGGWRDALTTSQIGRIEAAQVGMMARLGYAPTTDPSLAPVLPGDRS